MRKMQLGHVLGRHAKGRHPFLFIVSTEWGDRSFHGKGTLLCWAAHFTARKTRFLALRLCVCTRRAHQRFFHFYRLRLPHSQRHPWPLCGCVFVFWVQAVSLRDLNESTEA